jgi:hypothetical protein
LNHCSPGKKLLTVTAAVSAPGADNGTAYVCKNVLELHSFPLALPQVRARLGDSVKTPITRSVEQVGPKGSPWFC